MSRIVVLDENMINMIAAGEVIERPASVVKELTENSIDAGAKKVTITIKDGGRKLIAVTDDGIGMDAEDLAKAFEPHATSKICKVTDLHRIGTLGFRGEALASIASVANVKAVSRQADSLTANSIEIDCGKRNEVSPAAAGYGTMIEVRDLFYKLPARRKFLRTANTETSHVNEQFVRIALAHPEIDFTLVNNTRETYRLLGGEPVRARIGQLFGEQVEKNLVDTETREKVVTIRAWLGTPAISRTNNKLQYVFLNGRFIRDKFISHAIREAYRGQLESNRYAAVFIFIEMPCEYFDVNVHPTKVEVRFYNANLVHSQVLGCLREKLLSANFQTGARIPQASDNSDREAISRAMEDFFARHRAATSQSRFEFSGPKSSSPALRPRRAEVNGCDGEEQFEHMEETTESWPDQRTTVIQIHDSYIIRQTEQGFVIIDQHALHERILYEKLRARISAGPLQSQKLLIPETFEITTGEERVLRQNTELMEKLGIETADFGPRTVAIQAFPVLLAKADAAGFLKDVLGLLEDGGGDRDPNDLLDEILNMAACKAAIKAGQRLSAAEIEHLLAEKERVLRSGRCPHGRPTTISFSISELEKQFKRT